MYKILALSIHELKNLAIFNIDEWRVSVAR